MIKRTLVMAILDGWGIGRKDSSNPIYVAEPQNIDYIKHHYPAGVLQASGIAVGLPWGEEGNSEIGHLTLGSGKVLYQHYPRISLAIRDGNFFKNQILLASLSHLKETGGNLNLVGLISEGNVHASMEHLQALIKLSDDQGLAREKLNLHLFTDGIDSAPRSAIGLINKLGAVKIASVSGRFYAMDKERPERTQIAYDALTGKMKQAAHTSPIQTIEFFYNKKNYTDEYVEPTLLDQNGAIKDGDSVIFFNFREDRMRNLVNLFTEASRKKLYMCTFTNYGERLNLPVAFPPENVTHPLGHILAEKGATQLRIAETEKASHVTFFFNGLRESPFKNEFRVLIPSRNVLNHDQFPEMRAPEITERTIAAINENAYDFILLNYANGDMIAHTGNYEACLKAVKIVDEEIGKLMKAVLNANGTLLITSDHGNVERLIDPRTGRAETKHDSNPVPIYIVNKEYERIKDDYDVNKIEGEGGGVLTDVAPTILELMGISKPKEMTGVSLLNQLR